MQKLELFIPWWLENRGLALQAVRLRRPLPPQDPQLSTPSTGAPTPGGKYEIPCKRTTEGLHRVFTRGLLGSIPVLHRGSVL